MNTETNRLIAELIEGESYKVSYMPTKYLYERVGIFKKLIGNSIIFDIPDSDKEFFSFNTKFLKSINPVKP